MRWELRCRALALKACNGALADQPAITVRDHAVEQHGCRLRDLPLAAQVNPPRHLVLLPASPCRAVIRVVMAVGDAVADDGTGYVELVGFLQCLKPLFFLLQRLGLLLLR